VDVDDHTQRAIEAVVLFGCEVVEFLKRQGFVALQESVPGVLKLLDLLPAASYGRKLLLSRLTDLFEFCEGFVELGVGDATLGGKPQIAPAQMRNATRLLLWLRFVLCITRAAVGTSLQPLPAQAVLGLKGVERAS
jgi:hypothetical protein